MVRMPRLAKQLSRVFVQRTKRRANPRIAPERVHRFVDELVGNDLHAKRVLSLSSGVCGVMHASSLAVHAIGEGLAAAAGLNPKHAIKQIDRLLSNAGIDVWELFALWVPFVLAKRREVVIALDWTEFDRDDQATIAAQLLTSHGRSTPLVWLTVRKSEMADRRNEYEDTVIERLHEVLPAGTKVTLLADRGFGDQKLYTYLRELGWGFVIRFRQCIQVANSKGELKPAIDWLAPSGRARKLTNVFVTVDEAPVPAVVVVHAKNMKAPWCLATSRTDLTASAITKLYGKRFRIEETFRDTKDLRYGLGLSSTRISKPARRDRLLLLFAMSHSLLTLLGAACEEIGLDRMLRANTVKRRTHSLFRQGSYWFSAIPSMDDDRLEDLMEAFGEIVAEHAVFTEIFGVI